VSDSGLLGVRRSDVEVAFPGWKVAGAGQAGSEPDAIARLFAVRRAPVLAVARVIRGLTRGGRSR
jgi:hypothetical protein